MQDSGRIGSTCRPGVRLESPASVRFVGVLAVYVVLLTIGVVLAVPAVLRAIDGHVGNPLVDGIGIAALFAGVGGLVMRQIGGTTLVGLIVAAAIGLAAGVVHPELFAQLGSRTDTGAGDAAATESPRRAPTDPR